MTQASLIARMGQLPTWSEAKLRAYLDEQLGAGTAKLYRAKAQLLKAAQEQLAQELATQAAKTAYRQGQKREEQRVKLGLPAEPEDVIPDLSSKLDENGKPDPFQPRRQVTKKVKSCRAQCAEWILDGLSNTEMGLLLIKDYQFDSVRANTYPQINRARLWQEGKRLTLTGLSIKDASLLK